MPTRLEKLRAWSRRRLAGVKDSFKARVRRAGRAKNFLLRSMVDL
jgi:hypothetical protein